MLLGVFQCPTHCRTCFFGNWDGSGSELEALRAFQRPNYGRCWRGVVSRRFCAAPPSLIREPLKSSSESEATPVAGLHFLGRDPLIWLNKYHWKSNALHHPAEPGPLKHTKLKHRDARLALTSGARLLSCPISRAKSVPLSMRWPPLIVTLHQRF